MELDRLPGRDVGELIGRVFFRNISDALQLKRVHIAVADLDTDHVAVHRAADAVNAVFEAKLLKIVGIKLSLFEPRDLLLKTPDLRFLLERELFDRLFLKDARECLDLF